MYSYSAVATRLRFLIGFWTNVKRADSAHHYISIWMMWCAVVQLLLLLHHNATSH